MSDLLLLALGLDLSDGLEQEGPVGIRGRCLGLSGNVLASWSIVYPWSSIACCRFGQRAMTNILVANQRLIWLQNISQTLQLLGSNRIWSGTSGILSIRNLRFC